MKTTFKQFLFLITAIIFLSGSNALSQKLGESFTDATFPPAGWRTQHVAGALTIGTWERATSDEHSAPGCARSLGGLLADNFLITKRITPSTGDSLVFWVSSNYVLTALGRLDVKISTTDSIAASFFDFIIPLHITLGLLTPNVYVRRAVSLNDYAGQPIYIAFRHIEVGGLFGSVRLDGVLVGGVNLNLTALIEAHSGVGWFPVPQRDRDTVTVSVRSSISPYNIIESRKVYLDTLGKKTIRFETPVDNVDYYIVVEHRNALRTWSKTPVAFTSGNMTYDFTTGIDKAYGDNMIIVNGKSYFFSGDVTHDGFIDLSDVLLIYNDGFVFATGPYLLTDLNWDQYTDLTDILIAHNHSVEFREEEAPQ